MTALFMAVLEAQAFTTDEIEARVAEVAPLRKQRLGRWDPEIPASAYATVAKGDVATGITAVPGSKARIAWGLSVLEAPIDRLFSAVNDDRNKPDYSKLSHVELLEGEFCAPRRLTFQYLPIPIISDRWWVIEQRINAEVHAASAGTVREMVWVKLEDGLPKLGAEARELVSGAVQAASNDGGWWLVRLDDEHTLMEFWALSDPGGSVPAGLATQFASGSIRETFTMMGDLARKGPSCAL
ncbi:MAG: hypothetical protein H6737_21600 [Alphaproteobacteria bacterium]|nr:hypothetical protein [Alphaproteobacteria bacterium]